MRGSCMLTKKRMKQIERMVDFVGTSSNPKWAIRMSGRQRGRDGKKRVRGMVECPCHASDGAPLTENEAVKVIVGQVASIGIPNNAAKAALRANGFERNGYYRYASVAWNERVALSVMKMVKCWRSKCLAGADFLFSACYSRFAAPVL